MSLISVYTKNFYSLISPLKFRHLIFKFSGCKILVTVEPFANSKFYLSMWIVELPLNVCFAELNIYYTSSQAYHLSSFKGAVSQITLAKSDRTMTKYKHL